MQNLKVSVEKVTRFEDPSEQVNATLRLASGGTYTIPKKDPRFAVWSRLLKERQASGQLVYVESDLKTRTVTNIFLPSRRRIEFVASKPEEDRLKVILFMAPSVYFVKTSRADYDQLRRTLEEAVRTKAEVLVTAHPDTQEILDVRRP
jgi:hypothetical protein